MIGWMQISSGRGPEECRWVVYRLVGFLIREAARCGLKAERVEAVPGNFDRTFKSALLALEGSHGVDRFITQWQGSVRWVGKSMFRPHHKRRNWFVSVKAIEPVVRAEWRARDIRVDRMRSSGPGGQHANKTESAVRVTHVPTGKSAVSREERSQHLNRKLAMARLQALIRSEEEQARKNLERARWQQHNCIERGNAAHVFKGTSFHHKP